MLSKSVTYRCSSCIARVGRIRRQKTEPAGVRRAEADPRETVVGCPKPSWMSDFNRTNFSLCPSAAEGIENDRPKDTWSSRLRHYRLWISSRGRFPLKWRSLERSDNERQYAWRCCGEPDFSIEQQHPDCRCRQLEPSRSRLVKTCAPADRAIKLLLLRRMQLHILLRSLRWLCTPEVSTSTRLLHCRIWSSIQLLISDCPHSWRSPSRCNRLRLKLSSDRKECCGLLCQLDIWTHAWLRFSAIGRDCA